MSLLINTETVFVIMTDRKTANINVKKLTSLKTQYKYDVIRTISDN